jgi:hypothetical protein
MARLEKQRTRGKPRVEHRESEDKLILRIEIGK